MICYCLDLLELSDLHLSDLLAILLNFTFDTIVLIELYY